MSNNNKVTHSSLISNSLMGHKKNLNINFNDEEKNSNLLNCGMDFGNPDSINSLNNNFSLSLVNNKGNNLNTNPSSKIPNTKK